LKTALSFAVVSFGYGGITSYVAILSRSAASSRSRSSSPSSPPASSWCASSPRASATAHGPKVLLYPAFASMPFAFALLAAAQTRAQMSPRHPLGHRPRRVVPRLHDLRGDEHRRSSSAAAPSAA
jgi:hypothetical protein